MRWLGLALGSVIALAACGAGSGDNTADNTAGMGVPQHRGSVEYPGDRRPMEPRMHVAGNGCFLGSLPGEARRYLVVWPADTEQGSSGDELRLPDGTVLRDGDLLAGDGLLMPVRKLEGFGDDGYWDFAVGFCTPRASEVLVLDSVTKG